MSSPVVNTPLGVACNVLSSVLFAAMYAYSTLLAPLGGDAIYGWRILLTVPCLTVLVIATGCWPQVRDVLRRVRHEPLFWATRLLSSALLGAQLWLFMWAPVHGYGLEVSLGYFLLPLTMVVLGRYAFGERISGMQRLACLLALAGIISQLLLTRAVSWPTLAVCLGYPGYFWLRRVTHTNNLGGVWVDMGLSLPVSLWFVSGAAGASLSGMPWLVLGLGVLSAAALGSQALSAPRLSLSLFGLLTYVEPVLLVMVALLLGETISPALWPTYFLIWAAVVVLVAEGSLAARRRGRLPAPGGAG
ncbi:Chloramphenicol-sensitive protein rarD [plant metagenome]|uniref:Chloramphenicol-sensitive protein rarD n=1 Tax=plant metagenome TaxID=1297885 RepID=A0A484UVN7_9ZZZZ